MGTITFTVTETGQATAQKTFTMPDADIDRFVAAWQQDANPPTGGPGVTGPTGPATRAQVLLTWVNAVMNEAKQKVNTSERLAAQAALAPPPPVTVV